MILEYRMLDFNPDYFISNRGFVISLARNKFIILKARIDGAGYSRVYIRDISANKRKDYKLHRLVAQYFIDNPNNLPVVNHKDGNKLNNRLENLEWTTFSENNIHAYKTGLSKSKCHKVEYNGIIYESKMDAAKALKVDRRTIDHWIEKGKIKLISTNNIKQSKKEYIG